MHVNKQYLAQPRKRQSERDRLTTDLKVNTVFLVQTAAQSLKTGNKKFRCRLMFGTRHDEAKGVAVQNKRRRKPK
jgi:hypothetical protein